MMKITNQQIYERASTLLTDIYGKNSTFRRGQYEAIESVFTHKRTLIVEKTGWGKSLIYFIVTKMLRERGNAATIVISPLLVLMDNQKEAAEKLNLKCTILSSKSDKDDLLNKWERNEYDIIFITPETLFNDKVQRRIDRLKIGLFVIDEVHCISDYGHDFRLKYMRLKEIVDKMPLSVPIVGVTATANNFVIEDLKSQLGDELFVLRGPLTRETLNIQVVKLDSMVKKYAWILSNIKNMPGSGIIYCLTQHDCNDLEEFLKQNGINCMSYHNGNTDAINIEAINKFRNNEIKVIIATIKLGMGYDKEDIEFVIHLQMSENIVSYYQQIGRAGRNIDNAYIFLLYDVKDKKILDYFINTAFPKEIEQEKIYEIICNNNGIKEYQILSQLNFKKNRVEKALAFLENDGYIYYDKNNYYSTSKTFKYNRKHYERITILRKKEVQQMIEYANTTKCYNKYLANSLEDFTAKECGKCSNCTGKNVLELSDYDFYLETATCYLYNRLHIISPRKQNEEHKKLDYINMDGICLSYYGDYGYGQMLEYDKYNAEKYRKEIVYRCASVIKNEFMNKFGVKYITCVPSTNNKKMEILCRDISSIIGIQFVELLEKKESLHQKEMENSYFQCINAKENYNVKNSDKLIEKIVLIDDIVDSKWTLTWCGYYLMQSGIKEVYPFAISDSSNRRIEQ